MLGELISIALMIAATALLIKWGSWLLSNIDEALEEATSGEEGRGEGALNEAARRCNDHHSTSSVRTSEREAK